MDNYAIVATAVCATLIVKYGSIFRQLRRISLFSCPLCLGVWMGWVMSFLYIILNNIIIISSWDIFSNGMLVSIISYGIHIIYMVIEDKMKWAQ